MAGSILTANPDVWGYIIEGGSATEQTGTNASTQVFRDTTSQTGYRGYWSFDTSGIRHSAVIHEAVLNSYVSSVTTPPGYGGGYILRAYYAHDEIGASLDGSEWGNFSYASEVDFGGSVANYAFDFVLDPSIVNKEGDTDFEVRDYSNFLEPPGGPTWNLTTRFGKRPPYIYRTTLYATYSLQGVVGKIPNASKVSPGTLATILIMRGLLPQSSRVVAVRGDDVLFRTRFFPKAAVAC